MDQDKFEQLTERAGGDLAARMDLLREKAEHFIAERVEQMVETGEALRLDDGEIRLVKAFRSFLARSKPGETFTWTVPAAECPAIVLPETPSLIVDPREATCGR